MAKSISCKDAGKDCGWSATAETEEQLMEKVTLHVKEEHPEIELNPENIGGIQSLFKDV